MTNTSQELHYEYVADAGDITVIKEGKRIYFSEQEYRWFRPNYRLVYDESLNLLLTYRESGFFTTKRTVEFLVSELVEDGFSITSKNTCVFYNGDEVTLKEKWIPFINPFMHIYMNGERIGEVRRNFGLVNRFRIKIKDFGESFERNFLLFFICVQANRNDGDAGGD
ncbi:hypothetical protein POV27_08870 [Aureisphaera galaxeae]|uniref:hypothetical protein n=1 Tax=Aureisphaera galaxeae TaxID=1538023 RepID=UPI002350CD5A|nr:hypothetical protein [Aureisphaera galaxeae]MDC8004160.1 hypothetical protein [Aureisphaera galaxeae]